MADDEATPYYWLVLQGRTFTAVKSAARPDLSVPDGARRKRVFHRSRNLEEHQMMAGRLEKDLGSRRVGAVI